MSYRLRDHTADVAVEAEGDGLGAVFAAVADGLAAAMSDEIPATGGDRFSFEERAESREALLYDYLDRLIYERDVRSVLPVDNEAAVREVAVAGGDGGGGEGDREDDAGGEWVVEASARGVPLDRIQAREIKAVTYSEMDLSERESGWHAYVVFDV